MFKVFNMGHRLEIYTSQENAEKMIAIATRYNIDSQIIGHTVESENKKLTIRGHWGSLEY
jgi:phosphoribosylformylglycinamidine cyclo-ligase